MTHYPLSVPFNLRHTLESGQFFQWQRRDPGYIIRSSGRIFYLEQRDAALWYEPLHGTCDHAYIRSSFRLDDDLNAIFGTWSEDPLLPGIHRQYHGLRLMRQDPWECLVSFLCSAASNIPRITGNIRTLSRRYGTRVQSEGTSYFLFPRPEQLQGVTLAALYDAGLGFRAKFLHALIQRVSAGFSPNALRQASYHAAKTELLRLHGIGEKIADCVLLFSLDQLEAFPVDTWIEKILRSRYFPTHSGPGKHLATLARAKFGRFGGYAQQYLYHYARSPEFRATQFSDE